MGLLPIRLLTTRSKSGLERGSELLLCGVLTKGRLLGFLSVKHLFGQGRKTKGRNPMPWPGTLESALRILGEKSEFWPKVWW